MKDVLGFEIKPWTKYYWLDLFLKTNLELYSYVEKRLQRRENFIVEQYVDVLISESREISHLSEEQRLEFRKRWLEITEVFNENHNYLSFMIVLLRKNHFKEQQELFIEENVLDYWNLEGPFYW